jgi:hypothetical protein
VLRGGRVLNYSVLRAFFRSPVYVGRLPDGGPANHQPLIDEATWGRVRERAILDARLPAQASGRYLLTGLIRCPRCGGRMGGRPARRRHTTKDGRARVYLLPEYVCRGPVSGAGADRACGVAVSARSVDAAVLGAAGDALAAVADPRVRSAVRRAWDRLARSARDDDAARRVAALERAIEAARRRISDVTIKLVDGVIDRAAYDITRDRLRRELDDAEAELADVRGRDRAPALPPLDDVLRDLGDWTTILAGADVPARRDVLAALIERVVPVRVGFGRYEADIAWTPIGVALRAAAESV